MSFIHVETWKKIFRDMFIDRFSDDLSRNFQFKGFCNMVIKTVKYKEVSLLLLK